MVLLLAAVVVVSCFKFALRNTFRRGDDRGGYRSASLEELDDEMPDDVNSKSAYRKIQMIKMDTA